MRRYAVLLALLVAALCIPATPSQASHWCNETNVDITPSTTPQGVSIPFTIGLENTGLNDTQLRSVEVSFSWSPGFSSLGGGSLPAGGSRTFTTFSTPSSSGAQTATVRITGSNEADPPGDVICTKDVSVTVLGTPTTGLSIFTGLILWVLIFVIIIVVVVVIVAIVASRKPKPPQAPPPYYGPPMQPPYQPPTPPPTPPPQQPPTSPPPSQ